ncbi:hypothetical protein PVAP13_9NG775046 [Panicum virgatum]|uniref:Uncharacterized protein n=1 Tax=Panicum virgatum TaxID=38727 RepID=A0A8T0MYW6_PANVG|nr:hypothetical protein PVAP13_9NG775046 [Panicum virgatum]
MIVSAPFPPNEFEILHRPGSSRNRFLILPLRLASWRDVTVNRPTKHGEEDDRFLPVALAAAGPYPASARNPPTPPPPFTRHAARLASPRRGSPRWPARALTRSASARLHPRTTPTAPGARRRAGRPANPRSRPCGSLD